MPERPPRFAVSYGPQSDLFLHADKIGNRRILNFAKFIFRQLPILEMHPSSVRNAFRTKKAAHMIGAKRR